MTRTLAIAALAILVLGPVSPAYAGIGDPVDCDATPTAPQCTVEVIGGGGGGGQGGSGSGGTRCYNPAGVVVPCFIQKWGWLGDDGCYYRPAPPEVAELFGRPTPPAAWYEGACVDVTTGQVFLTRLRVFAAPPGQALLAAEAVRRLRLPAPVIGVNPPPRPGEPARALVRFPTWLWLGGGSWGQRSATASIPTLSVTATATAVVVVWSTGDGGSERCGGPGVAWREGMDLSAKPPCGHTYLVPSPPGAPFTLRATVTWRVTWTGTGGISGTEPDLQTTAAIPLRVVESQALNFGAGG